MFLAEEIEQGIGLAAVPIRRVVHDEYDGHQPEKKNELSLAAAVTITSRMKKKVNVVAYTTMPTCLHAHKYMRGYTRPKPPCIT